MPREFKEPQPLSSNCSRNSVVPWLTNPSLPWFSRKVTEAQKTQEIDLVKMAMTFKFKVLLGWRGLKFLASCLINHYVSWLFSAVLKEPSRTLSNSRKACHFIWSLWLSSTYKIDQKSYNKWNTDIFIWLKFYPVLQNISVICWQPALWWEEPRETLNQWQAAEIPSHLQARTNLACYGHDLRAIAWMWVSLGHWVE